MSEQYVNLAASTSAGSINNSSNPVTFSVQTGDGTLFPATTNGSFRITVSNADGTNAEVMLCTSRTGDSLTCARGSSATNEVPTPTLLAHNSGSVVSHNITVGAMDQIRADEVQTGTFSGLPSVSKVGDLYLPTDSVSLLRSSASGVFAPWGPVYPLTATPTSWTFVNQNPVGSTDSSVTANGYTTLTKVGGDATGNVTGLVRSVIASKSFTITALCTVAFGPSGTTSFENAGLLLTAGTLTSSACRFFVFGWSSQSPFIQILAGTALTGGFSNVYSLSGYVWPNPFWMRIKEDASNRTYFLSSDGQNFIQVFQEVVTAGITTTNYGICTRSSASNQTAITLHSWKETNP